MRFVLVATLATLGILAMLMGATALPGSTAFLVRGACGNAGSYGIGGDDFDGAPINTRALFVRPGSYTVPYAAGDWRLEIHSLATRIDEAGADGAGRFHLFVGGCAKEPGEFIFHARGVGVVKIETRLV